MAFSIKDMSVDEFTKLVKSVVAETIVDRMEELIASKSESYINSIEESRKQIKNGEVISFEDAFNV